MKYKYKNSTFPMQIMIINFKNICEYVDSSILKDFLFKKLLFKNITLSTTTVTDTYHKNTNKTDVVGKEVSSVTSLTMLDSSPQGSSSLQLGGALHPFPRLSGCRGICTWQCDLL
jgi:hypothetical protein